MEVVTAETRQKFDRVSPSNPPFFTLVYITKQCLQNDLAATTVVPNGR